MNDKFDKHIDHDNDDNYQWTDNEKIDQILGFVIGIPLIAYALNAGIYGYLKDLLKSIIY